MKTTYVRDSFVSERVSGRYREKGIPELLTTFNFGRILKLINDKSRFLCVYIQTQPKNGTRDNRISAAGIHYIYKCFLNTQSRANWNSLKTLADAALYDVHEIRGYCRSDELNAKTMTLREGMKSKETSIMKAWIFFVNLY